VDGHNKKRQINKDYLSGSRITVVTESNLVAHLQTANLGATAQWLANLIFVVKRNSFFPENKQFPAST